MKDFGDPRNISCEISRNVRTSPRIGNLANSKLFRHRKKYLPNTGYYEIQNLKNESW